MLSNARFYGKWLALVSAMMSLPAHSMWLDTSGGLSFGVFTRVSPTLTGETNTFHYTYGDPAIFDEEDDEGNYIPGTLEQVLAAKDRRDADRRLRLGNNDSSSLQIAAQQVLTKDYSISGSTLLSFNENNFRNYGANWGVELMARNKGTLKIGSNWAGLDVAKTRVDDILSTNGTNLHLDITAVPNLTVSGFHMLAPPNDTRDRRSARLIKADGASVAYEYNMGARQSLRGAIGTIVSEGHANPFYIDVQKGKGKDTLASLSYQYEDIKLAMDVGQSTKHYNGIYRDKVDTKLMGLQVDYELTPRLHSTLNYSRSRTTNSKPVSFLNLLQYGADVNEGYFFHKVNSDNYRVGLSYNLYKGVSLKGSVENDRTKNFLVDGEFSRRNQTRYNAGATFSF